MSVTGHQRKDSISMNRLKRICYGKGIAVADVGVSDLANDTPCGDKQANRAMLFCGTGMGMAIVANKHPHVYATVCEPTLLRDGTSLSRSGCTMQRRTPEREQQKFREPQTSLGEVPH